MTNIKAQTTEQIQPRLLTIKQASVYLGMSVWSVRSLLIWSGKVPVIRLGETGKRQLLDKRDLDAFIDRQKEWREG